MSEGVEWVLHSCLNLAWAEGRAVPAGKLAAFYDLPPAYLNRQLQALARAGIVASTSGPRGGFRLARDPAKVTLLDVVVAIEGEQPAFRCQQIMRDGPGGRSDVDYRSRCLVSQAMSRAELAWRRELAGQTLADIKNAVESKHPDAPRVARNRLTQSGR
ncbi:Rrf2 family transcriptional regulator [Streptomyces sp. 891-h]|uniref:RrF2 family transcriptional regulator n=1 Tax=unclassified Streptomyces TaxID=2593676 RepID=UPI001FA9445D|nr:Rrf2 family transcriptional regulator [Streptomyces sp. 891-h]UNZ15972.1 Rrf2 family transcriptional regulator [Streptomyces sp. 891-h]